MIGLCMCVQLNSMVKQDGNDSLDMLIRRAVGKDPFLSFPRPDNNPVQLFQLLHNLERPGMIGSDIDSYFSRLGISGLGVI